MLCFAFIKCPSSEEQTVIPLRYHSLCSLEETVCWGLFSPTQGQNRRVWSGQWRCDDRPVFVSGYCQDLSISQTVIKKPKYMLLLYATLMRGINMWQTVQCQLWQRDVSLLFVKGGYFISLLGGTINREHSQERAGSKPPWRISAYDVDRCST